MELSNKVIVVTGAGNGVGRELTLQLLARGAMVVCVDIDRCGLDETVRMAGENYERVTVFVADITNQEAVEALPTKIIAQHGAVDAIINNAGIIHPFLHVEEIKHTLIEKVMRVNFYGALNMTKAFLPYLRLRPNGYIVNISSAGALSPMPGETIYGASKAAVRLMSEGLRYELRSSGIRVMTVFPGGINTNIIDNCGVVTASSIERLRAQLSFLLLTPQKVARRITNGMQNNRARLVLGIDANVMDICGRISPRFAPRILYRLIDAILTRHVRPQGSSIKNEA